MTPLQAVKRARSAIGVPTVYMLGRGGTNPDFKEPGGSAHRCDCSGAIAWFLGVNRKTDHPFYAKYNGGWLETSAITRDATLPHVGLFDTVPWEEARLGDLLVYGDKGGHQGHVGMVSEIGPDWRPALVIHCSAGNYRRTGDAIQETSPAVFLSKGIIARYAGFV